MTSGDEIIGVIGLASETERDFERRGGFLETLANQVSVALTNARLYEIAQQELAERKRVQESLRESETRYRTLVECSLVGVVQTAPDGRIVYANPAMLSMFEAESLDEIVGGEFRSLSASENREIADRELEKRSRGINSTYEVEIAGLRGGRRNVVICGCRCYRRPGS